MPYFISDIRTAVPQSGHRYLFDANIWLAVLETSFYRPEYNAYTRFFNSIVNNTHNNNAKIAVPCLLLSEVINRIIKDIYMAEFKLEHPQLPGQSNKEYLNYYRKNQYPIDLENVCASIRDYHQKIEFVSDNIHEYSCKDLIKNIPAHLDVNDYLYSKMALAQGLVVVTHDGDFNVEDIYILTTQRPLLDLMA